MINPNDNFSIICINHFLLNFVPQKSENIFRNNFSQKSDYRPKWMNQWKITNKPLNNWQHLDKRTCASPGILSFLSKHYSEYCLWSFPPSILNEYFIGYCYFSDVPNAPKLVSVNCEKKEATIRWSPSGDNRAPISRYIIQYNTSFTPDAWENAFDNVPATDMAYIVSFPFVYDLSLCPKVILRLFMDPRIAGSLSPRRAIETLNRSCLPLPLLGV